MWETSIVYTRSVLSTCSGLLHSPGIRLSVDNDVRSRWPTAQCDIAFKRGSDDIWVEHNSEQLRTDSTLPFVWTLNRTSVNRGQCKDIIES